MNLQEKLRRFSAIGVEITSLAEESKKLRAELFEYCESAMPQAATGKYEFLIGHFLWTVEKSLDGKGKDINVLFREIPGLPSEQLTN